MTDEDSPQPRVYYVVEKTTAFISLAQAQQQAPQALAEHVRRSTDLHQQGRLLMAGAFLEPDPEDGYLRTMAVCPSHDAAEDFISGDPFVQAGHVQAHRIRPWANMVAR